MRLPFFALFLLASVHLAAAALPVELEHALKSFRTEGAKGWAFVQTTESAGKSLVERYDPAKPSLQQWSLLQKNGQAVTPEEARDYAQKQSMRSGSGTAPNVKDQIDPASCEVVSETPERRVYRFRLLPGGDDDKSAQFMTASFTLHRPTGTIEQVELASIAPFAPMFGIKVAEARTVMTYSLPEGDRPTLLQQVTLRIRGRAFLVRSLDQDMTVTYSEHAYAGKKL